MSDLGRAYEADNLRRAWRWLKSNPDATYKKYCRSLYTAYAVADRLLSEIEGRPLYHAVHAEMIATADGRLDDTRQTKLNRIVKKQWRQRSADSPELLVSLGRVAIRRGLLTYRQTRYAVNKTQEWWSRAQLVEALTPDVIGEPSLASIANQCIRQDAESDVCMMAAQAINNHGLSVDKPLSDLKRRAAIVLREYGIIRRASGRPCGIDHAFTQLLGATVSGIRWKRFFGNRYRHAERQAISCRSLAETNITAFVPALDVFNDLLLDSLYRHDASLGKYNLGSVGSVLSSTRLRSQYPSIHALVDTIHKKRLESELAHPVVRRTGKPTGRIRYGFVRQAKKLLVAALSEIRVV